MLSKVLSFLDGVGGFFRHITDFFKESDIRSNQKQVDALRKEISDCKESIVTSGLSCEDEINLLKNHYEEQITMLKGELEVMSGNIDRHGRDILG